MQPVIAAPSRALVVSRTLLGLASLLVGAGVLERIQPGLGWLYAVGFLVHIWILYPRFICLHCPHYGRVCPSGGGKISALFFDRSTDQHDPATFARRKRIGHLMGIALRAVPIVLLVVVLSEGSRGDLVSWAFLGAVLVVGFAEGKQYSSRTCRRCRAFAHCPARWSTNSDPHELAEADPS